MGKLLLSERKMGANPYGLLPWRKKGTVPFFKASPYFTCGCGTDLSRLFAVSPGPVFSLDART